MAIDLDREPRLVAILEAAERRAVCRYGVASEFAFVLGDRTDELRPGIDAAGASLGVSPSDAAARVLL